MVFSIFASAKEATFWPHFYSLSVCPSVTRWYCHNDTDVSCDCCNAVRKVCHFQLFILHLYSAETVVTQAQTHTIQHTD